MSKFSLDDMNTMYVDVLKEIGNIGAGNATTAIATMINARMNMHVPTVFLLITQQNCKQIVPSCFRL